MSKGLIYLATIIALILSVWLWFSGNKDGGLFVGIWVPSILALGAFSHIAKRK